MGWEMGRGNGMCVGWVGACCACVRACVSGWEVGGTVGRCKRGGGRLASVLFIRASLFSRLLVCGGGGRRTADLQIWSDEWWGRGCLGERGVVSLEREV